MCSCWLQPFLEKIEKGNNPTHGASIKATFVYKEHQDLSVVSQSVQYKGYVQNWNVHYSVEKWITG